MGNGNGVFIDGVCKSTETEVTCWNLDGKRLKSLALMLKEILPARKEKSGIRERYVVIRIVQNPESKTSIIALPPKWSQGGWIQTSVLPSLNNDKQSTILSAISVPVGQPAPELRVTVHTLLADQILQPTVGASSHVNGYGVTYLGKKKAQGEQEAPEVEKHLFSIAHPHLARFTVTGSVCDELKNDYVAIRLPENRPLTEQDLGGRGGVRGIDPVPIRPLGFKSTYQSGTFTFESSLDPRYVKFFHIRILKSEPINITGIRLAPKTDSSISNGRAVIN